MVLTIGFTVFLLAGGLFILVQPNTPLVNRPGGFSFVYPGDIHNQTGQEALLSTVTIGMGLLILVIVLFIGFRYFALRVNPDRRQHSGTTPMNYVTNKSNNILSFWRTGYAILPPPDFFFQSDQSLGGSTFRPILSKSLTPSLLFRFLLSKKREGSHLLRLLVECKKLTLFLLFEGTVALKVTLPSSVSKETLLRTLRFAKKVVRRMLGFHLFEMISVKRAFCGLFQ
jgi:hypothetical protein